MNPMLSISVRVSPSGSGPANFSTGLLSPVSWDWSMNRSLASMKRTSPGIMSPEASLTISPGTASSISISMTLPLRMTSIRLAIIFCSFWAALLDFSDWTKAMTPEMMMTSTSMMKVAGFFSSARITSVKSVTSATIIRTMLKGLITASLIRLSRLFSLLTSMMFRPYSSSRSAASTWFRPSGSVLYFSNSGPSSRRLMSIRFCSTSRERLSFLRSDIGLRLLFSLIGLAGKQYSDDL